MLNGKSILITGGTGSFGKRFVQRTLARFSPRKLIIFSRDELKQYEMAKRFPTSKHECLRYFIGDVRDQQRLSRALEDVDIVIHAAAMKHVEAAEYNPFECIKTNVLGAQNVIEACIERKIKTLVALSTDKASSPINLYGATKLCSDKMFTAANAYAGGRTSFSVVRYGNVIGSRGSVIPFFMQAAGEGVIPITDERMTRFWISLDRGIDLVMYAIENARGGEILVPKIPSMRVTDLAEVIAPECRRTVVGIRPGEKLHESMISLSDAPFTYEYDEHYAIYPAIYDWHLDSKRINGGKLVAEDFSYSSDNNRSWLSKDDLVKVLAKYRRVGTELVLIDEQES